MYLLFESFTMLQYSISSNGHFCCCYYEYANSLLKLIYYWIYSKGSFGMKQTKIRIYSFLFIECQNIIIRETSFLNSFFVDLLNIY